MKIIIVTGNNPHYITLLIKQQKYFFKYNTIIIRQKTIGTLEKKIISRIMFRF